MVSRYLDAKIYKIVNSVDNLIYVGSTIKSLSSRFTRHIYASKWYPERKLYKHFAKLGIDHFEIILIKNYPCAGKTELEMEEERYKIDLNAQLNTNRAHQTAEQKKEQKKEYDAQNYKKNRAKLLLQTTAYYKKNCAKINERILCKICGKTYTKANKSRHCKSKRHQKCVHFNQSKISTDEKYEKLTKINYLKI
jgi:hypothetical protein